MVYLQYGKNILRRSRFLNSECVLHHPVFYGGQGVRYRKLEVILTSNVDKLGKAGETVKVAPGHFRNHLMPKLLAVPNIDKFAYLISEQRKVGLLVFVLLTDDVTSYVFHGFKKRLRRAPQGEMAKKRV
ncbi:putative ribosomal protein L9 [Helianthus annuus]|nr:putative ribosomal protein L9 [Helianthus annuus]